MRSLVAADLSAIASFDARLSGMDRRHVLAYLLARSPAQAFAAEVEGRITGYVVGRPGRTAFQVGPIVSMPHS